MQNPAHFLDPGDTPWGFISPTGKVVNGQDTPDSYATDHNRLARTMGFSRAADLVNKGWTRFAIIHMSRTYRLIGTLPQPWDLSAKHLTRVVREFPRPVTQMMVDLLDEQGKIVGSAGGEGEERVQGELRKLVREKNPYLFGRAKAWGFISPTGKLWLGGEHDAYHLHIAARIYKSLKLTSTPDVDYLLEDLEYVRFVIDRDSTLWMEAHAYTDNTVRSMIKLCNRREATGLVVVEMEVGNGFEADNTNDAIVKLRAKVRTANPLPLTDEHRRQARGNKFNVLVEMTPMEFLRLTTVDDYQIKEIMDTAKPLSVYNDAAAAGTNIIPCFLTLDISSGQAKVMGHEGRHRAAALFLAGEEGVGLPVYLRVREASQAQANAMLDKLPGGRDKWLWDTTYLWGWDEVPDMIVGQFRRTVKVPKMRLKVVEPYVQERGRKARGL